jgi:Protein of unknown function (DUF5132)
MAFLEDIPKGGLSAVLVGLGTVIVAPIVIPALRPVAKTLVRGGVMLYDMVKESVADAGEQLNDMVAEVRSELAESAEETNGASEVTTAGRSKRKRRG